MDSPTAHVRKHHILRSGEARLPQKCETAQPGAVFFTLSLKTYKHLLLQFAARIRDQETIPICHYSGEVKKTAG